MNTAFPLSTWTRDWSQPLYPSGTAHFAVEDRGHDTPCWIWQGATKGKGYGAVTHKGRGQTAHRAVYEDTHGPVPDGLQLDHLCRNPKCVNPDHLEPVSSRENVVRGRGPQVAGARMRDKTHCPHGHAYAGSNLHTARDGKRYCRACWRAKRRASSDARASVDECLPSLKVESSPPSKP